MNYIDLFISEDIVLRDAMKKLDVSEQKILFITDSNKFVATLTDGDIRRYLINGGNLDDNAVCAGNTNPKVAHNYDEAKALYDDKNFVAIPVINNKNEILDIYIGAEHSEEKTYNLDIPVVVNAGGKGTRLYPYTKVLPKPLIPVGDIPIIEHIMKQYQNYGCNDFHIIVNYKKELMKAYFTDCETPYDVSWYDEEQPLGTGGGLSLLKRKLDKTFFFANCDTLILSNYDSMIRYHKEHKNVITMVCAYKHVTIPYGIVEMGDNGSIDEMREKPELTFLTNTGMYIVEPEVIGEIQDGVAIGFPDIIEAQKAKGRNVGVYPIGENEWLDMGQLPELEKMRVRLYGE